MLERCFKGCTMEPILGATHLKTWRGSWFLYWKREIIPAIFKERIFFRTSGNHIFFVMLTLERTWCMGKTIKSIFFFKMDFFFSLKVKPTFLFRLILCCLVFFKGYH